MLRVLADASCLRDARREAGIGRYATLLLDALRGLDDLVVEAAVPDRPPRSESRPGRWVHAQPSLAWRAMRTRPDLLHALGGEPALGWVPSRQVVTLHDVELWTGASAAVGTRGRGLRAYGSVVGALLQRCAAVIAVSRVVGDEALATLGLDGSRIHVVPHGVTPGFSATPGANDDALRAACGVGDHGAPCLVWTGSLRTRDPRKALDVLVDAVAALGPRAVRLVMVGAPGAETRRIAALARQRQVDVVLPGHVPDATLAALLRGAAAAVIPSLHEGFGLPALEAMACGAPLVASHAGNLPDLVDDAALLVPPGDPRALRAALAAVAFDGSLARKLRAAGPRRAALFTWRHTAELTADVYRRVAGQR